MISLRCIKERLVPKNDDSVTGRFIDFIRPFNLVYLNNLKIFNYQVDVFLSVQYFFLSFDVFILTPKENNAAVKFLFSI